MASFSELPNEVCRSPFANGATFVGFEVAMRALDKL